MKARLIVTSLLLGLLFSSCSALMYKIMGVKQPNDYDLKEITAYASKFGIPDGDSYLLDTTYLSNILQLHKNDTLLRNNLMQPLQIRFYQRSDTLLSLQPNCTAGGFPNLKWNKRGQLNTIPPNFTVDVDTCLLFCKDVKYLIPISNDCHSIDYYNNADYNIILFWSVFMNRQSKILIKEIQNYQKRFPDKKMNVLYVNTDKIFSILEK